MKLLNLERAEQLLRLSGFLGASLEETFRRNAVSAEHYAIVQQLLDDQQFHILLHLKRSEHHALLALEELTVDTEYLRNDLEQQLHGLQVLLGKVEQEEHLRRDREVLLSDLDAPSEGVLAWISGKNTG